MPASDRRAADAVDRIYEAVRSPELWPGALDTITGAFDDIGAMLVQRREGGGIGIIVSPALEAVQREYETAWWQHDVLAMRALEPGYLRNRDTVTDQDIPSPEDIAEDRFSSDFLARHGWHRRAAVSLTPAPNVAATIILQRSASKPLFDEDELALLSRLGRHVETALRLGATLANEERLGASLGEALSRLGVGVFAVDGTARVLFANPVGKRLLTQSLTTINGSLSARGRDRPALASALAAALDVTSDAATRKPPVVMLRKSDDTQCLAVYVLPLASTPGPLAAFLTEVRALVVAIESSARDHDPAIVSDVLGVTLGEARVAALVGSGLGPRAVAARLGITEETARTTLKRVFGKAGVSRQVELATLITRLVLGQPT